MKKLLVLIVSASVSLLAMPGCNFPGSAWLSSFQGKEDASSTSEPSASHTASLIQEIHSEAAFTQLISNNDKLSVVKFGAPWCGACKQMAPAFEAAAHAAGDQYVFADLNIDKVPGIAEKFGINGIPVVLLYKNGQEVGANDRLVGSVSQDKLLAHIQKHLIS